MEFSDDDESTAPPTAQESDRSARPQTRRAAGAPPGRRGRPRRPKGASSELAGRRLVAVGIGLVILAGILFAFKGCLDARKDRNYENYARDLEGIVAQSKQLSTEFFDRLENPSGKNLTELSFEAQVSADRGSADNLLERVQNLSAPGELSSAQTELMLSFQLRSDALSDIADELKSALAKSGNSKAIDAIANDMRSFLASDVLYDKARDEIIAEFGKQDLANVNGKPVDSVVPRNSFLPDLDNGTNWLSADELSAKISAVAGDTGAASPGLHGVALTQSTLQPDGLVLTPDTPLDVSVSSTGIDVDVENQGDSDEKQVTVSVSGAGSDTTKIASIPAGGSGTASLTLQPPAAGTTASVTVTVSQVNGEELTDNNEATYQLTFN